MKKSSIVRVMEIFNSHYTCEKFSMSFTDPSEMINLTITQMRPYQSSAVVERELWAYLWPYRCLAPEQ